MAEVTKKNKFTIVKDIVKNVRRFNLQGRTLEFKIKPIPQGEDPVGWIKEGITQIIHHVVEYIEPTDQVGITFCSKDFKKGEGWLRFHAASEIVFDDIWEVISSVYQSNSVGLSTETFCLGITTVKMPAGKGNERRNKYNDFAEECSMRKGIISINNKDNLCLPRALVVAKAYIDKAPEHAKIRKDTGKIQTQLALKLIADASVIVPEGGCGIPEIENFQRFLQGYKITIYNYGNKGRDAFYEGRGEKKLNLLHYDGHYNVITSLTASFCCGYFCEECRIPYNKRNAHRCGGTCSACQQSPACPEAIRVKCVSCIRSFRGQACYDNHMKNGSMGKGTVCAQITRCHNCLKVVRRDRDHVCNEYFCKICKTHVPEGHLCYIQVDKRLPKNDDLLFIFYDLETRQENILDDGSLLHEPNLCVFKQCCDVCLNTENQICEKCGPRLQILKNNNPVERFIEFILNQRKIFKKVVILAHNAGGFDGQFLLNHILTKTSLTPHLITRGKKIISMEVGNVKFLDYLNYLPMKLSALPKAFGLDENFKKGFFPYLFNTNKNEYYIGPLPALEFYNPDTMKVEERIKFLEWYEEHKANEFDMQKEIIEYCIADVEILTQACLKFRQQLLDIGNVDPFTEACTIASSCNKVYRRNFLKPNTIGIIPKNGYRWRDNQSKIAIQWLVWEEQQRGVDITHAAKQKEVILNGVKVDGYCSETNQVFQFEGCYFHGHTCFRNDRTLPLNDNPAETLNSRFEATTFKTERIREFGYEVIQMWECEFKKLLRENETMRAFTESHPLVRSTPLNPRDAFYGGRTGNTRDYYKVKEGETIKYVDVCSLYPWVCKYGKFPVNHPKIHVGEECSKFELSKIEGLIKCKILPPDQLYHPVLPCKMNEKLMFILCRTCGENFNCIECNHTEEQRVLTGTWVMDEVRTAVRKGYKIIETYEIWEYKIEQYDKHTRTGGIFWGMMNKFIKTKQQASGWPNDCCTLEERGCYIENFLEREDVKLEFTEIVVNPGLRSLAKLMLNSFWGKFGQRENMPQTKIINKPDEFYALLTNPAVIVNGVIPINENTLVVNLELREEACDLLTTVNVAIAGYVTTQARLKLYSYLEQLGDSVLYYDTDSVIYVSRPGKFEIPLGDYIGDMTDELASYGTGSYITEFVSGGPKNYAYKVFSPQNQTESVTCKVKGICLNYAASKLVNFETIKMMILKENVEPISIISKNIRRTTEHKVVTKEETKIYRPNSTKRIFLPDHNSLPYGFKQLKL